LARVTVRLYADLRAAAGKSEVEVEATSVKDLIEALVRMHGPEFRESLLDQSGRLEQFYRVYVNKKMVPEDEMEKTFLRNGDLVQLFPPVSGGYGGGPSDIGLRLRTPRPIISGPFESQWRQVL
jgi:MoaD family protein